jgi:hypothetical protein
MLLRPQSYRFLLTTIAFTLLVTPSAIAQSDAVVDLYTLCSNFPHNSRCKGYTAPTPLSKRPGISGVCILKTPQGQNKGDCKVTLGEKRITLYQEIGNPMTILENQRDTQAVTISTEQIGEMSFRSFVDHNWGGKLLGTLLFGASAGAVLAPDRQMAEIAFSYADPNLTKTVSNAMESEAKIVMRQSLGYELRSQLEQMTGKPAASDVAPALGNANQPSSTLPADAKVEIKDLPGAK